MPTFNYSTKLQFFQALRDLYKDPLTPKFKLIKIAKRFWTAVQTSEITDAQIKNAFNINDTQLAALKTKFQNQATTFDSVSSATGQ
jgi:hypothetical protein